MIFTKPVLKTLRTDIDAALAAVAAKHGITLDIGNISFDSNSFRTTLSAKSSDVAVENDSSEFDRYAARFGIKKEAFNEMFSFQGDMFTVVGIKPRSTKYPLLAKQRSNGKTYKLPVSYLPAKFLESWAA